MEAVISAVDEPEPAYSMADATAISGFLYGAYVIRKPLFIFLPSFITCYVPVLQATGVSIVSKML